MVWDRDCERERERDRDTKMQCEIFRRLRQDAGTQDELERDGGVTLLGWNVSPFLTSFR